MYTPRLTRLIVAAAAVLAAFAAAARRRMEAVGSADRAGRSARSTHLRPQSSPFLTVHATGVQKYACQANGTWLFTDPEAALYTTSGSEKPVGSPTSTSPAAVRSGS